MIINPYLTTYGKVVNISKTIQAIKEYLIKTELRNLNYEYMQYDECGLVFITGCNEDERKIPPFNNPIITEDIKGNKKVVVDVRSYIVDLSKTNEQPLDLRKVSRDLGNLDFCAYRGVVTAGFVAGYYGFYKKYSRSLAAAYGLFVGYLIDSMVKLNPSEMNSIEIAAAYFLLYGFIPNDELNDKMNETTIHGSIISNLSKLKLSYPVNPARIEEVCSRFLDTPYTGTIDNLMEYLVKALDNEKSQILDKNIFINMLTHSWYGHGASETTIIGMENLPTWIVLVYSVFATTQFKKARLNTILTRFGNKIDVNTFIKDFKRDMEEHNNG